MHRTIIAKLTTNTVTVLSGALTGIRYTLDTPTGNWSFNHLLVTHPSHQTPSTLLPRPFSHEFWYSWDLQSLHADSRARKELFRIGKIESLVLWALSSRKRFYARSKLGSELSQFGSCVKTLTRALDQWLAMAGYNRGCGLQILSAKFYVVSKKN